MRPEVSVLMPTYNRARFIGEALQSVLGQTCSDFEIIVVDDGSTDNTTEIVSRFADPRIHLISQPNQGVSKALNTCLTAAQGDYIVRLDSDDAWLPNFLEMELAAIEDCPEIGLVYSIAQAMDINSEPLPQTIGSAPKFQGETLKSIIYGNYIRSITALVRKSCYDLVGLYDETQKGNEDWDMWIRLARITEFAFINQVLAKFRIHTETLTSSYNPYFEAINDGRFRLLDKIFSEPDLLASVRAIKPTAYRNAHIEVALRYLAINDFPKTWHHFHQAIAASDNAIAAIARIAFLITYYRFLSQHHWSNSLVDKMVALRRA